MIDDPLSDDEIGAHLEKNDRRMVPWGLGLAAVLTVAIGAVIGLSAWLGSGFGPSLVWIIAGVTMLVSGLFIAFWVRAQPKGWTRRSVAIKRETALARQTRWASLLQLFALAMILVVARLPMPHVPGFMLFMTAAAAITAVLNIAVAILGPFLTPRRLSAYADDELAKAQRGQTAKVSYVSLGVLLATHYLITMASPGLAPVLAPVLLWLAVAIPTLTYVYLSWSAETSHAE